MIREVKKTDYPILVDIWESAVLSTHDFLKKEDFLYYREHLPTYFQYVTLYGYEQDGRLVGFIGVAENNMKCCLFIMTTGTKELARGWLCMPLKNCKCARLM